MQSVWHVDEVKRLAQAGIAIAPSPDFAAGVFWLAQVMGATWQPYEKARIVARIGQPIEVTCEVHS